MQFYVFRGVESEKYGKINSCKSRDISACTNDSRCETTMQSGRSITTECHWPFWQVSTPSPIVPGLISSSPTNNLEWRPRRLKGHHNTVVIVLFTLSSTSWILNTNTWILKKSTRTPTRARTRNPIRLFTTPLRVMQCQTNGNHLKISCWSRAKIQPGTTSFSAG